MIVRRLADLDLDRLFGPHAARSDEMQALHAWMSQQDAGLPDPTTLPPQSGRALADRLTLRFRENLPDARVAYDVCDGLDGTPRAVGLKIVTPPEEPQGTILYLHGGGWAFSNLETHERFLRVLAHRARRVVVAVDYRLAPEHPYPTPLQDCVAAWRWLAARRGEKRFAGPCAVAGDSAGANLSLALLLAEQARAQPIPDDALLFYGCYRAAFETPSYRRFAEGFGLTTARMRRFWSWYAPGLPDDPLLQPLLAGDAALAALPPLFVTGVALDPLLSDTLALVGRLEALGHPHRFVLHEGVHHGFLQWTSRLEAASRAVALAAQWLEARAEA